MPTEMPPAAPLIYLLIYLSAVLTMIGTAIWLARRPAPLRRVTLSESDSRDMRSGRTFSPSFHRPTLEWPAQLRDLAHRWRNFSLFTLLECQESAALWVVFGVALVLRLAFLETLPGTVTADELDFAGNALSILRGQGPHFFGIDWAQEPALSVYMISWSWRLFGTTIFAERLVAALLTAVAVFPFYALLRRHVAAPAALAAALLLESSCWFLHFSRSGWTNGPVILYTLLAAWALVRALERQRWRDWIVFGATLALLLYGYHSGRAVVFAFLAYLVFILWWRWRGTLPGGWQIPLAGTVLAGGVCLLLFLPIVRVALSDLPRFTNRTSAVFIFNSPRPPGETTTDLLIRQTWTAIRSFVLMDTTTGEGRYKGPGQAWLDPISAAFYTIGLVLAARRGRAAWLWWCLFLIPLGMTQILTEGIPDGARGLVAVAPMLYFVALTLDAIVARRLLRSPQMQLALAGVVVLAVVLNVRTYLDWMALPQAAAVRQPAVPAAGFYLWRDFQLERLADQKGIMNAGEYNTLPLGAIAAQLAGEAGPEIAPEAPLNTTPQELPSRQVATIGGAGDESGQLNTPRGIAIDRQGNYYVADPARGKIVRYAPDGTFLTEWGNAEQLTHPWSVVVTPDNTIAVLDADAGRIVRYDQQGTFLGVVATLSGPTISRGMTLGLDGRIYVANTAGNRLIMLPGTGPVPTPLTGPPARSATYDQPTAAIAAADGTYYVYEPGSNQLRGIGPDGRLRFTQRAPSTDTISAGGLALLPDGRLLLADPGRHRVMVYRPNGELLGYFMVEGTPQGLGITPTGMIAVTDANGRCIRVYALGDH